MSGDSCHDRESAEGRGPVARFTPGTPRPVAVRIEWEDHACGLTINDCPECQTRYRRLMDETLELVPAQRLNVCLPLEPHRKTSRRLSASCSGTCWRASLISSQIRAW